MSEVEKHYGSEAEPGHGSEGRGATGGRPGPGGRSAGGAREPLDGAVDAAKSWSRDAASWAQGTYEDAASRATYARRRSAARLSHGHRTIEGFVEENPIMVGVVGLAAGMLIGALLPGTRRENQVFGHYADEVRDQGLKYAQDMAEQGRHMVQENLSRVASGGQAEADRD